MLDAGGVERRGSVIVSIQPGTNPIISFVLSPLVGNVPINATLGSFAVTLAGRRHARDRGTAALTATILDANGSPWRTRRMGGPRPGVATVVKHRDGPLNHGSPSRATTVVASFGGTRAGRGRRLRHSGTPADRDGFERTTLPDAVAGGQSAVSSWSNRDGFDHQKRPCSPRLLDITASSTPLSSRL